MSLPIWQHGIRGSDFILRDRRRPSLAMNSQRPGAA
jgi:hypothetical protein